MSSFYHKFIGKVFEVCGGKEKTASKNGTDEKARAVLELLSNNNSMTGEDISNQCSFVSRAESAGTLARLVRAKAIESVPASYRITESGKTMLQAPPAKPQAEPTTETPMEPKKGKRKSKKEPQTEPNNSQGEEKSSP